MYCVRCGTQVADDATQCPTCGNALRPVRPPTMPQPVSPQEQIPTYLPHAIVATLLCCMPAGVVSIVYAAQVSSKQAAGDIAGARQASKNALMWGWISFAGGLAFIVLCVILGMLGALD